MKTDDEDKDGCCTVNDRGTTREWYNGLPRETKKDEVIQIGSNSSVLQLDKRLFFTALAITLLII